MSVLTLITSFVFLLAIGVPISFGIGIATLLTMLLTIPAGAALTTVAQRIATGLDSFALLAIPFFILSGQLMGRGGIARRLIDLARVLVGSLPGGLAHVNILASMLFGAISGSAVAATSAIGGFMIPTMNREGYEKNFNVAINVTASTTGLLIPPSNVLIVYSLASGGVSIAALFVAGYLPGILVGLSLMVVAAVIAMRRGYPRGRRTPLREALAKAAAAVPSLMMIVIVIGGIITGVFTATEASVIAVLYAMGLSLAYREVKIHDLPGIVLKSVETTAIVMLLVGCSTAMSWIMAYENIPQELSTALLSLTQSKVLLLLLINVVLLTVGTFMDITPAILIFTPILLPVVTRLGVTPLHFGILLVLNLCIGLCTPPVGTVLFVGCSVGKTSISRVIRPLLPLFLAMVVSLLLVTYVPAISLWLPKLCGY